MTQNEALIILIVMKKITPVAGYKTIFVSIYFYAVFAPSNFHFHALLSRSMGYEGEAAISRHWDKSLGHRLLCRPTGSQRQSIEELRPSADED